MKIIKSVTVKHILTEEMRQALLRKFRSKCEIHERACAQLHFEEKKLSRRYKEQKSTVSQKFAKELKEREDLIKNLRFQINQLEQLPLGSELKDKTIDSLVDVNVGDNWDEIMGEETILIKDGIVQEIRREGGFRI